MTRTERLLCDLIALPSVNPAFCPGGQAVAGERPVSDFLAAFAARAGLDVEFQKVLPGRANVLARLGPAGPIRRRVLLVPHLDTVHVADERQWNPLRKAGRIWGRGACDTKGSIAAMLGALVEISRRRRRPMATEILFAGVVDEEYAQAGSRALLTRRPKADLAIVGEPTRLQVVTAHKGSLCLRLNTRGRSAHGSRPDLGRNAIHAMARVVEALETDYAATLRRRRHPLLGCPTVSVGTIQGGSQPNIVPEACSMTLDRRTLPGETEAGVRREISAFLAHRNLKTTFASEKLVPCPPMETNPDLPLVRQLLRCRGQRWPAGAQFFCDAAVLSEGGIPSVVFGPGDIAQAHTAREWISVTSLQRASDFLVRFLLSLP
jgi:acetylornithine deacetylase/succinyl-diaminopimelate desuccinylase-like protein